MYQSQDPFSLQFGPITPTGSVTSQLEETAPPPLPPRPPHRDAAPALPPRPSCLRRRPVPNHNAPRAGPSPSTGSPTQVPQFVQLPNSFDPPPVYSSSPPNPRAATPNIPPPLTCTGRPKSWLSRASEAALHIRFYLRAASYSCISRIYHAGSLQCPSI
jgi:hypothetical protein